MAKVLSINKRSKHFKEVLQEIQEYIASKHSLFNLNDKEAEAKQLKKTIYLNIYLIKIMKFRVLQLKS